MTKELDLIVNYLDCSLTSRILNPFLMTSGEFLREVEEFGETP